MFKDKDNTRQILAYITIAGVTLASILAYTLESWRGGAIIVGLTFLLLGLLVFLQVKKE